MNENLNLVEILKNCPKGTKLYSTVYGEVELVEIIEGDCHPIRFKYKNALDSVFDGSATKEGHYMTGIGECTLFPSKTQRDWCKFKIKKERFDPATLKPFDKVLVRDNCESNWHPDIFGYKRDDRRCQCVYSFWKYCIPFNEETEHLMGTNEEAPEFYRYWED